MDHLVFQSVDDKERQRKKVRPLQILSNGDGFKPWWDGGARAGQSHFWLITAMPPKLFCTLSS
jgi:hypothetical protein